MASWFASRSRREDRRAAWGAPLAILVAYAIENIFAPMSIRGGLVRRDSETHKGEITMRFMVLVPGDKNSEAGVMPDEKLLAEMTAFNEQLVKAGVMLAGEGLHPTSRGARVRFNGKERTVIDGPFTESKELVAGFWIWQVKSKEEAIEWLKRAPFDGGVQVELRQIFEAEDFGDALTPELREKEARMRTQIAAQRK